MRRTTIRHWAWRVAPVLFAFGFVLSLISQSGVGTALLVGIALGIWPLIIVGLTSLPPGWRRDRPQGYPIATSPPRKKRKAH